MDEIKEKVKNGTTESNEFSSIFANYQIDELEFSFRQTGELEKAIESVKKQGQLIKKSRDSQNTEYAFSQGRVVIDTVPLMNSGYLLRLDVITQSIYDSAQLIKSIGL